MTTPQSAQAFAAWLADNQPQVFEALLRKAMREPRSQLSGLTDWLSSIGTTVTSAVGAAGRYLASEDGMKTVSSLGALYLQTQAQRDALRIQTAHAQAGQPPAPIYSAGANPNTAVPIYQPTGQPLSPTLTQQLLPAGMTWTPILLGGGFILLAMFAFRR